MPAILGKFSHDELENLEKEFKDHEKRIEEYRQMADKIVEHNAISDNDIRFLVELKINQVEMANNQKYCATLLGNKIKLQIRKKNQAI